jgi:hypothetical protein
MSLNCSVKMLTTALTIQKTVLVAMRLGLKNATGASFLTSARRDRDMENDVQCTWTPWNPCWFGTGTYDTECGNTHYFSEGGISDNNYRFCPFCGKPIKEIAHDQQD